MMAMNKWSIGYLLVGLLITGEGVEFISFLQRHPSVLWELASFSVASALGQFFIFMTVSDFGPLPCSIITTTRSLFIKTSDWLKKHKSTSIWSGSSSLSWLLWSSSGTAWSQGSGSAQSLFLQVGTSWKMVLFKPSKFVKICTEVILRILPLQFFWDQASSWTGYMGSRRRLTLKRPRIET